MSFSPTRRAGRLSPRPLSRYFDDVRRVQSDRRERAGGTRKPEPAPADKTQARIRELVEPHLYYVVRVASEFHARDVPFEELLAEGNMGLVEAAHRFDPRHKVKFLSYAVWWIRKRMLDYLNREGKSVHLTRYARERQRELNGLRELLRGSLRRDPTLAELSAASGLTEDFILEKLPVRLQVVSLDQDQDPENGGSLIDRLARHGSKSPEERVNDLTAWRRVREEIAKLPPRPRAIIENRFGLDGRQAMTFQEIGDLLGMSRERARQLEKDTLGRLRSRLMRRPRNNEEASLES